MLAVDITRQTGESQAAVAIGDFVSGKAVVGKGDNDGYLGNFRPEGVGETWIQDVGPCRAQDVIMRSVNYR